MISLPKAPGFTEEFVSEIHIPVLVVFIEFHVLFLSHVHHCQDASRAIGRHVLHGSDWEWYHLLEMMHFIDVLCLSPELIWLSDKDKFLILVVPHLGNIVEIHSVDESCKASNIECMRWSHN